MEYKHERFVLNRFCEFQDREIESDFREYHKLISSNNIRLILLLMGFIFAVFAFSDYYFYGGGNTFIISLTLRGAGLFIAVVAFTLVGNLKRYEHTLLMITVVQLLIFGIYLLNLYTLGAREPALQFMSVMLFILSIFLIPNLWKNCIIASAIIWVSYIVFCLLFTDPHATPPLGQRVVYLGICLLACAVFIFGRESSQRKQFAAEKLLEFMSITDRLTGLYNRGRFEYILNIWIKNKRHDPFCLILFDIDDFKKVNDRFGHMAGDQVLVGTSGVVTANIRDEDIFARWGGEEFVILFSGVSIERAEELAERLRKAVEANSCGEAGRITISIGVAQFRRGESILDLINRADENMYKAKRAGKNQTISDNTAVRQVTQTNP